MNRALATEMPVVPGEHDQDLDLVRRYLSGDMLAFDELMTRHERQIYGLCFRLVRDREDAMDLTQEVFIKAFENLASFRGHARFKTWLYRVAVNHCLNHISKTNSRRFVEVRESTASVEPSGHRRVLDRERREIVAELIEQLPPRQRAILKLRMHEDLSYEEIARILGRSVSTVKSSVFFALAKLKKMVGQDPGEPKRG